MNQRKRGDGIGLSKLRVKVKEIIEFKIDTYPGGIPMGLTMAHQRVRWSTPLITTKANLNSRVVQVDQTIPPIGNTEDLCPIPPLPEKDILPLILVLDDRLRRLFILPDLLRFRTILMDLLHLLVTLMALLHHHLTTLPDRPIAVHMALHLHLVLRLPSSEPTP